MDIGFEERMCTVIIQGDTDLGDIVVLVSDKDIEQDRATIACRVRAIPFFKRVATERDIGIIV
jgi:hypothetical protein